MEDPERRSRCPPLRMCAEPMSHAVTKRALLNARVSTTDVLGFEDYQRAKEQLQREDVVRRREKDDATQLAQEREKLQRFAIAQQANPVQTRSLFEQLHEKPHPQCQTQTLSTPSTYTTRHKANQNLGASNFVSAPMSTGMNYTQQPKAVNVISFFTGAGGCEYALQQSCADHGLQFNLRVAVEIHEHCIPVLQNQYPGVLVMDETTCKRTLLDHDINVAVVTFPCIEHSLLKGKNRQPAKTEEHFDTVISALRRSENIELVLFENVPQVLIPIGKESDTSTFTEWIAALEGIGFRDHAYTLMNASDCGDLVDRTRVLAVHKRAQSLMPVSPLHVMLKLTRPSFQNTSREQVINPLNEVAPYVIAMTIGESKQRRESRNNRGPSRKNKLPPFGTTPSIALCLVDPTEDAATTRPPSTYKCSPQLAAQAMGFPEAVLNVAKHTKCTQKKDVIRGEKDDATQSDMFRAVGNMVSGATGALLCHAVCSQIVQNSPPEVFEDRSFSNGVHGVEYITSNGVCIPRRFADRMPEDGNMAVIVYKQESEKQWMQIFGREPRRYDPPRTLVELFYDHMSASNPKLRLSKVTSPRQLQDIVDDTTLPQRVRDGAKEQRTQMKRKHTVLEKKRAAQKEQNEAHKALRESQRSAKRQKLGGEEKLGDEASGSAQNTDNDIDGEMVMRNEVMLGTEEAGVYTGLMWSTGDTSKNDADRKTTKAVTLKLCGRYDFLSMFVLRDSLRG